VAIARGGGGLGVAVGTEVGSEMTPLFASRLAASVSRVGAASVARSDSSALAMAAVIVAWTICCSRAAATIWSISGSNATHVAVASAGENVAVGSTCTFPALDPVHDTIAMAPRAPSATITSWGRNESNVYRFKVG